MQIKVKYKNMQKLNITSKIWISTQNIFSNICKENVLPRQIYINYNTETSVVDVVHEK